MPRSNHRHPMFHDRHYHQREHSKRKSQAEEAYDNGHTETDVQEVWFAGCHCGKSYSCLGVNIHGVSGALEY
jgi:hypothetical protein